MNRTKKFLCAMGFGVATWMAMGPALADDPPPADQTKSGDQTKSADQSKSMSMMERKSSTATVMRVDTAKRHLTLKGENGMEFTVSVPESVKRLDEIKPGDKIKVDYYESVGLSMKKGGEGAAAPTERTLTERNAGKLPSGTVAHQMTGTVEIVKVDKAKNQVTVKRPNGDIDTVDIKDPDLQAQLGNLKEGDKIQATYTEAAAISVQREGKSDTNKPMKPEDQGMKNEPSKGM